ncbi:DUF3558 family protein [Streptomyces sodiiphilus]|uniref:DUF3558 family protein n=1 Tax=Streptomyces sodiiphilus TaxID=226217 RepID=A0ABN2PUF8_9ACTN
MDRTVSRLAVRALAWAAVPVLLVAGCSSDTGGSGTPDEQAPAPAPSQPAKYTGLPDPCSTVGADTVGEVVPEADQEGGQALNSKDTTSSGTCLWNGLDGYQFRSLTVSLKRFDSDTALGHGDERAADYLRQQVAEITGDEENSEVEDAPWGGAGDEAHTLAYTVTKSGDDDEDGQEYRQHRVVARTANVVVTVDYSGAGFEDAKTPGAEDIQEAAEAVAEEAVAAVDATAPTGEDGGETDGEDAEDAEDPDGEEADARRGEDTEGAGTDS